MSVVTVLTYSDENNSWGDHEKKPLRSTLARKGKNCDFWFIISWGCNHEIRIRENSCPIYLKAMEELFAIWEWGSETLSTYDMDVEDVFDAQGGYQFFFTLLDRVKRLSEIAVKKAKRYRGSSKQMETVTSEVASLVTKPTPKQDLEIKD
ncbi:hypothetical protein G9A89_012218 [Geosiphon pyriformis]|nr:hypothetical protein G9A89_012218 [Geosiphon pyriformis]